MSIAKYAALCIGGLLLLSYLFPHTALAHRPVIVRNKSSKDAPVLVTEPEISWAFYGVLEGESHYYKIVSQAPFELYVNILVPDLDRADRGPQDRDQPGAPVEAHEMSFQVYREGEENTPLITAEGLKSSWRRFYEEYGRDHYYMGPEFGTHAEAGTYYVRVYNGANEGRYALAIGKKEKFTFFSLIGAIVKAKSLDRWFFK